MKPAQVEYRVVWRRTSDVERRREFRSRRGADRFMALLGPEPWTAYHEDPDARCEGHGRCDCEWNSCTVRECHERRRADLPVIEYVRLETRRVGPWRAVVSKPEAV